MSSTRERIITTALVSMAGSGLAFSQNYQVRDLGLLTGQPQVQATGINDSGATVGLAGSLSTVGARGVFWAPGTVSPTDLGVLPNGQYSTATAINNAGVIVGNSSFSPNGFQFYVNGYRLNGGVMTALTSLPDRNTSVHDINDAGIAVGGALSDFFEPSKAAVWGSDPTNPAFLGELIPAGGSQAFALNNNGWIVGEAQIQDSAGSFFNHAFAWTPGTGMVDLGTFLTESTYSRAYDVNDLNQIVGYSENGQPGFRRAVLWDLTLGMIDLGTLNPGMAGTSEAHAVNASGQIVGFSGCGASQPCAVLWQGGHIYDLNDLLLPFYAGWRLVAATDINAAGEIVGYGYPPGSPNLHGFILTELKKLFPGQLPPSSIPIPWP